MSAPLPETVDAWRMVTARRSFQGTLPIAAMSRLKDSLASTDGHVDYELEFGKDGFGIAFVHVQASASLVLTCQRTLEPFVLPVAIDRQLGLIVREEDEAGLPPGYEPLLTADGHIEPLEVIEDELLLALPVVPTRPDAGSAAEWSFGPDAAEVGSANPFAVLGRLNKK